MIKKKRQMENFCKLPTNGDCNRLITLASHRIFTDIDEEIYNDYNTDEPSPIDEEPEYDTEEELYLLYCHTILKKMN